MKHLFSIFIISILVSCSSSDLSDAEVVTPEPNEYTISLGLSGEISVDVSPLSRVEAANDLYGVQVYSKPVGENQYYSGCAYGLFDDVSKMNITLLEGYLYRFVVSMVVDGKSKISQVFGYGYPFSDNGSNINNNFEWKSDKNYAIYGGNSSCIDESGGFIGIFDHPFTDRYHGEFSDYTPVENGSILIDMKRTVFGVKYVADGLTDGKLKIQMEDSPLVTLTPENLTSEHIVTFSGVSNGYSQDNYSEDIPINISWEKSDGAVVPLVDETVKFTRKELHTITIKVKDQGIDSGVVLTKEPATLTDGENTTFEGGGGDGTTIEPAI